MNWIHRHEKHCCVVNPGSGLFVCKCLLMYSGGHYAKVKIQRFGKKWKVISVQHVFDYCN